MDSSLSLDGKAEISEVHLALGSTKPLLLYREEDALRAVKGGIRMGLAESVFKWPKPESPKNQKARARKEYRELIKKRKRPPKRLLAALQTCPQIGSKVS